MRTRNTSHLGYDGPNPKSIDPGYPDHSYELITCLVNGIQKRIIQDRWLKKFGYTKQSYLEQFPGAPLKSHSASDSYANAALNDGGRRSAILSALNTSGHDSDFQQNRRTAWNAWVQSDEADWYREQMAAKAIKQHAEGGLTDSVRQYFKTDYVGSEEQRQRSLRVTGDNNPSKRPEVVKKIFDTYLKNHEAGLHDDPKGTKKKQFKDYNLTYQSSYERDFLEYCEQNNAIYRVSNGKTFKDDQYDKKYYLNDFIIDGIYSVEIKSGYIEKLQEETFPGHLNAKKALMERHGYKWLYIKDKNYDELATIIHQGLPGKVG